MCILFKYATRSRRTNFLRGIDSIVNNLSDKENYHILISVDEDDCTMQPLPVLNCNHTYKVGKPNNKIEAINRDVNEFNYDWDILINMSDDMVFTQKDFDYTIRESFIEIGGEDSGGNIYGETDYDQCLHFPDGNRNDLITMSIMGRGYYNRFNYIYHPDYISLYCDNEQTEVAKMLGCYKYVDKVIFNHLHPAYGKAVFDGQYQHTESFNEVDRQTYLRRKENNFYI